MSNVTISWIKANVETLSAFGGQITLENFEGYIQVKTLQSTLTQKGKCAVESCDRKEKFHVLLPGIGWADCFGYTDENKKLGIEE